MTKQYKILPTSIVVRTDYILSSTIDSETVLLHLENSKYYGMDTVGSRIWELLEDPINLDTIIEKLMTEYEVTIERCEHDVLQFLTKLVEENLLRITNDA